MATVVQKSSSTTGVNYVIANTIATTGNVTAGNVLIIGIATSSGTANDISSITDTRGNTWTKAVSQLANGRTSDIWYTTNGSTGALTATINSLSYTQKAAGIVEINGLPSPLSIASTATQADTSYVNSRTMPIATSGNSTIIGVFAGTNGAAVYTGDNVITGTGDSTNLGMVTTLSGTDSVSIASGSAYEQGVFTGISVLNTPLVPPVYATKSWHPFGVQPSKTVAQLRTAARAKYDAWMAYVLATDGMPSGMPTGAKRIKVPDQGFYLNPDFGGTVSEGQGYGMLFKAWFSNPDLGVGIYDSTAKADFDALFKYMKFYKNANGLMNWNIKNTGAVADTGGATDGDLDIAMSLVIMSRLHSSGGTVNYAAEATTYINAIRDYEFVPATGVPGTGAYPNIMTNGDGWGFATNNMMPDYFRAGFMREFYYHTGDSRWLDIINANYTYMLQYYYDTYAGGMVPDRQTREHTSLDVNGNPVAGPTVNDQVTYNSVRLGFAVMMDYLWNGNTAPVLGINMMNKMADKAKSNFTTGGNLKAPNYNLDFTTWQTYSNLSGYGLVAPATLGKSTNQTFATEMFDAMNATSEFSTSYFNGGVGMLGMMTMSGLAQNYRAVPSPAVKRWNGTTWVTVTTVIIH